MNYVSLTLKTDYSLLSSLIKVDDLIKYAKEKELKYLAICDTNLYSAIEFYLKCQNNNIIPVIGLEINYNDKPLYLFAKDYEGYKNLIKIDHDHSSLIVNNLNVIAIVSYSNIDNYDEVKKYFRNTYIGYNNSFEKKNALIKSDKVVFINETLCFKKEDGEYLNYLDMIKSGENEITYNKVNKENKAYDYPILNEDDLKLIEEFLSLINLNIPTDKKYMPIYNKDINQEKFLKELCLKGLNKRLNNSIPDYYLDRLNYELDTIIKMGFTEYFLVVYDYVLYAKKNDVLVGPGRGSAASSLVSYSLGITEVDPIKYDLLFERFLNNKRISLPDIDIDFEDIKRDYIKEYVRDKYGFDYTGLIMTYGTMASKQVLIDLIDVLGIDSITSKSLLRLINAKESLSNNVKNPYLIKLVKNNTKLTKLIKIALKLENLKKFTSIHAAGIVISSIKLNEIVPTYESNGFNVIGTTYSYLESIGLIKMDFLGLNNLTIIHDCLNILPDKLKINDIPLDDEKTFKIYQDGDTFGIFQFEGEGIKNFIRSFKPNSLSDLYLSMAMYRPGPIDNIDMLIKRKENKEKITYIDDKLIPIIGSTYGIIVYQEQIMEIFRSLANYSYSEADLVRKAISKKNMDTLVLEREKFINGCLINKIENDKANEIFDLIVKFAEYGFNKAHSVAYSLISYQMAYLKANYLIYFILNMLNRNIGSTKTINEWIRYAQSKKINIIPCNINLSKDKFYLIKDSIIMPLSIIKGINEIKINKIISNKYKDIFDYVVKLHKDITKEDLINLINAGCFDEFNNRRTLINNLDVIYNYAQLADGDIGIVTPLLKEVDEYLKDELLQNEIVSCGMYVSNHPTVFYYTESDIKVYDVINYFDKIITTVVLVDRIKDIETKKKEIMYFITASDDTGSFEYTLFPNKVNLINSFKRGDIVKFTGKVTKRNDKYGIIINSVKKLNNK